MAFGAMGKPPAAPRLKRMLGGRPMLSLALLAAGGLMLFDLAPFDVSIDIGDLKTAIKSARLVPFGPAVDGSEPAAEPWSWTSETLTWMLVGGLFLLAFREAGRTGTRAIIASAAVAAALCLMIEVLQLTIRSRKTDSTSVFWSLLGRWWEQRSSAVHMAPNRDAGSARPSSFGSSSGCLKRGLHSTSSGRTGRL